VSDRAGDAAPSVEQIALEVITELGTFKSEHIDSMFLLAGERSTKRRLLAAEVDEYRRRFNEAVERDRQAAEEARRPLVERDVGAWCAHRREWLGRIVREVWVRWAKEQPNPKPSWLVPWEGLDEPDREVDRRIGEVVADNAIATFFRVELAALGASAGRDGTTGGTE